MIYDDMAKLNEQVVFKAPREWVEDLAEIAAKERRTLSAVNRAIWERGYNAFKRDGRLFDPIDLSLEMPDQKEKAAVNGGKKESGTAMRTGTGTR